MLAAIAVLVLVLVALLFFLVRRRRTEEKKAEAPAAQPLSIAPGAIPPAVTTVDFTQPSLWLGLPASFRRGLRRLRGHLGGRDALYRLPWVLLLGETATGKSRLLSRSRIDLPLGPAEEPVPEEGSGCSWWFLNDGVVLDAAGSLLMRPDGGGDDGGWSSLLKLLRTHRAGRPIDAVVLAIPAADLLESGSGGNTAAQRKAAQLHARLRDAQKKLGMCFPVYVLVTGCERVPGFTGFSRELPESQRGHLLGWSNPYALETAFRSDWMDEAFDSVTAGLQRAQLQIFGSRILIDEPDGAFGFPAAFQALREPLRACLGQIFRSSAYHEPIFLRGVYFSGELPAEAAAAGADAQGARLLSAGEAEGEVLFVRDLFERKVFPERGLARPGAAALAGGRRAVRIARISVAATALALSLGVSWAWHRLEKSEEILLAFLHETETDLRETREKRLDNQELDLPFLKQQAFRLFNGMATIDINRFGSVFLPSSWFDRFNYHLELSVTQAYDEIILQAMGLELHRRARGLICGHPDVPARLGCGEAERPARKAYEAPEAAGSAVLPAAFAPPPELGSGRQGTAPGAGLGEAPADEDLDAPAGELDQAQARDHEDVEVEVVPVEQTSEFLRLRDFVEQLAVLEKNANRYKGLRSSRNLKDLDELTRYLFDEPLPEEFFQTSGLYRKALQFIEYRDRFEPEAYRGHASHIAEGLAALLYRRMFDENPVVWHAGGIVRALGRLDEGGSLEQQFDGLRDINARLHRIEQVLAMPEIAWTFRNELDLGDPFRRLLGSMESNAFLGRELSQRLQGMGRARLLQLNQAVPEYQTPVTGPVLWRARGGEPWRLSQGSKMLVTALDELLGQGFARVESRNTLESRIPPGYRVTWDVRRLQEAGELYKRFEDFHDNGLPKFPVAVQERLEVIARDQLCAKMIERIAEAEGLEPAPEVESLLLFEREIQAEVENFEAAGPLLSGLASTFQRLGRTDLRDAVAGLLASQGYALLRSIDQLLREEKLYRPKGDGFGWWEGEGGVVYRAFNAGDPGELAAYLDAQRMRVKHLAVHYAEPVLRVLGDSRRQGADLRELVVRWDGILGELRHYDDKRPGNSVSELETLLITEMADLKLGNCFQTITARELAQPSRDFFLASRNTLLRGVYDRCQELAEDRAVVSWERIETAFRKRLAGRYPFAAELPGRLDAEADPESIRAFFRVYDDNAGVLRSLPAGDRRFGDQSDAIRGFVRQMDRVRAFFAAFLDGPAQAEEPVFHADVDFRVLRSQERGGNQVLDWQLVSGDARASAGEAERRLRWTPGDPVEVRLQWAKDSPAVPVANQDPRRRTRAAVDGLKVSYRYSSRWALLALIREHQVPIEDDDERGQVLRFTVDTQPAADPAKPVTAASRPDEARVYLRLTLTGPDKEKKDPLEPPAFPVRAPRAAANVQAEDAP